MSAFERGKRRVGSKNCQPWGSFLSVAVTNRRNFEKSLALKYITFQMPQSLLMGLSRI